MDRLDLPLVQEVEVIEFAYETSAVSGLSRTSANTALKIKKKKAGDPDNESITPEIEPFQDYKAKIDQLLADIGLGSFSSEALQHDNKFINCVYALTLSRPT